MCFIGKYVIDRIATENIECFKVVTIDGNNTIYSFYYEFIYELNKLYETELHFIKFYNHSYSAVLEGFHSYSNTIKYNKTNNNTIKLYNKFTLNVKNYE